MIGALNNPFLKATCCLFKHLDCSIFCQYINGAHKSDCDLNEDQTKRVIAAQHQHRDSPLNVKLDSV